MNGSRQTKRHHPSAAGGAVAAGAGVSLADPRDLKAVRKTILQLAGPSLVEMLLINFMQMLNMILVGRVGPEAVAAVGLASQPYFLLIAVFMTLNVGTTVIVARSVGAGQLAEANRAAAQAFALNVLLSAVIAAGGFFYAKDLLRLMGATEEVMGIGLNYARILFLSIGFNAISMALTAILRGAGDTRTPMKINVLSNLLVVAIGFPLIYGLFSLPAMGVTGAAVATIVSQFISMLWVTGVLFSGKYAVQLSKEGLLKPDRAMIGRILKIGLPTAVEQIIMRLGMLVFVKVAASLGTIALAATQIAFNVFGLTFMPGMAFSIAASTLVGQALGAGKPELAENYGWQVRKIGMIVAGLMGIVFILFAPYMMMMYTPEPNVIQKGAVGLRIMGCIQVSQATQFILGGALRGAGDTRYPLYSTFIGVWGFRVLLSLLFVYGLHWDIAGIWVAAAADQFIRSILIYARFKRGKWKTVRI
ncbi:MATE family efflux transporter [Paenibacillus filicis]|uniref:Probable multidrug resistance protein NorM n=1 Tax=Paenibacillus gyeongsangnamensis TaxID=3388067 RepID=A0ABT4QFA0_9BACL|nr:MATE family efflux transporter [Paenibacillus filicis]MCZ8515543.1 MATE family efflux transporter [Paenibacillus filicis]